MDNALLKTIRKSVASISLLALLSTFVSTSAFADTAWPFADAMPANTEVAAAATSAFAAGYMTGDGMVGGPFNADGVFNRAQAAKVFTLAYFGEDQVVTATAKPFPDVEMGEWYTDYVNTVKALGVMTGNGDGTFAPAANLQQEQVAVMIYRVLAVEAMTEGAELTGTSASDWWYEASTTLYNWSILDADNFVPGRAATRGWVVVAVERSNSPVERTDEETTPSDEGAVLTVELSEDSAMAGTVPSLASSVAMASFDFTASYGDVNIEKLVVKKGGVSDFSDSTVTLWNGSERLTSEVSINSTTDRATFNNVDVMVKSGETETLTVRMNIEERDSSAEVSFMVEDVDAVDAGDAEVQGEFPVEGDMMSVSTTPVGTVTMEGTGSLSDPFVGEKGVKVAQFSVSPSDNAGLVKQVTLYQSGSIDSGVIQNLELFVTGEEEPVATAAEIDGDLVTFVLDQNYTGDSSDEKCSGKMGYCIASGSSRTFYVTADFNTGRSDDEVVLYLDETFDLMVEDARYGYNMTVDADAYDEEAESELLTLQGGDITVSSERLTERDLAIDTDDVEVMRFTVSSENDVTFKEFLVGLQMSEDDGSASGGLLVDSAPTVTDIKVSAVDGSFTYGPVDADDFVTTADGATAIAEASDADIAYYTFNDDLAMSEGESMEFVVTVDVENEEVLAGETLVPYLVFSSTLPEIKDSNNKTIDNGDSLSPASTITGETFTIQEKSLEVTRAASAKDETVVLGARDVEFTAFTFTAGDGADVKVTDLTLSGYIGYTATDLEIGTETDAETDPQTVKFSNVVSNVNLYLGSVAEANRVNRAAETPTSSGLVEFNNLNWTIPAGETKTILVTGNIDKNTNYAGYMLKLDIASGADIEATDVDGDSIAEIDATTPNGGVSLDTGSVVTTTESGALEVTVASQTPKTEIVVGGSRANAFTELRFEATDESFTVRELSLSNLTTGTDSDLAGVSVRYFTNEAQTTEATATCSRVDTGAYRCNLGASPLYVPEESLAGIPNYAVVMVEADIATTSDGVATEGNMPALTFDATADFTATGVASAVQLTEDDADNLAANDDAVAGNDEPGLKLDYTPTNIAGSFPMVVAGSDLSMTAVSTSQSGNLETEETIMNLTVTADSADDVEITDVAVTIRLNEDWAITDDADARLLYNGRVVATVTTAFVAATREVELVFTAFTEDVIVSGSDNLKVQLDTATLISDASDETEILTSTIEFGYHPGTDTADYSHDVLDGGIVWMVDGSTTAFTFFGALATDKVTVNTRY